MAEVLDAAAVRDALGGLDQWSGDPTAISRTIELPSFLDAITAVDRVAVLAEELGHHPDIDIRFRTLTFRCSTHSAGGVTDRDVLLARGIDEILRSPA
ncbi:MAG TPA: 4a-hydroxytetrahydrobiopterin dehydratase [Micromonosporaceae bacterium]|nr:4a-hydroxytetrahydrobiopterin dehydratase [Micromonosporaceae bacterium]